MIVKASRVWCQIRHLPQFPTQPSQALEPTCIGITDILGASCDEAIFSDFLTGTSPPAADLSCSTLLHWAINGDTTAHACVPTASLHQESPKAPLETFWCRDCAPFFRVCQAVAGFSPFFRLPGKAIGNFSSGGLSRTSAPSDHSVRITPACGPTVHDGSSAYSSSRVTAAIHSLESTPRWPMETSIY